MNLKSKKIVELSSHLYDSDNILSRDNYLALNGGRQNQSNQNGGYSDTANQSSGNFDVSFQSLIDVVDTGGTSDRP